MLLYLVSPNCHVPRHTRDTMIPVDPSSLMGIPAFDVAVDVDEPPPSLLGVAAAAGAVEAMV